MAETIVRVFTVCVTVVVPLRHSRHVHPDTIATVVNILQKRVKSITLCVTLNANNAGKIVIVTLCIQIEWLFVWCETVPRCLSIDG